MTLEKNDILKLNLKKIQPKSVKRSLEGNSVKQIIASLKGDIATLNELRTNLKKYENKLDARQRMDKIDLSLKKYSQLLFQFENDSKTIFLDEISSEVPILRGGLVDKLLMVEKRKLNKFNCSIGIGFLLLYFKVVSEYDKQIKKVRSKTEHFSNKIEEKYKEKKEELIEQKNLVLRLEAQVNG